MPPNFTPPSNTAWLYTGKVMHARFKPKQHRFNYSVFNLCIDLDQLAVANKLSRFFSIARFNLLSFYERDHYMPQDKTARGMVDRLLVEAGMQEQAARVILLCYPRVLGFVFNPISVYFCYNTHGKPIALVYEVRNTFKQRHTYVAPIEDGQMNEAGIRQERDKLLYVSPFMDMQLRYFFRVKPPQSEVAIRILEKDIDGPILAATFHGAKCDLTTKNIVRLCITIPFMTLKVVLGIHYEALKLWLKGVRIKPRPAPPQLASYTDLKVPVSK
jgi:uncharacterized protein